MPRSEVEGSSPVLELRQLTRPGLAPLSLGLAAGACMAVQGPSGAGKSLLLRAIADLDPAEGLVFLNGVERNTMPAPQWRRSVGYLPAEPGWWGETVGEHFADWGRALPLIARLGLPDESGAWPVARASTGERQRLAFARALAMAPAVLLLDEPTAALDPASVASVEALVDERRAAGGCVLWVTHDPAQAARVATRLLRVAAGKGEEVAPPWTATSHLATPISL